MRQPRLSGVRGGGVVVRALRPKFRPGQTVVARHAVLGTEVGKGTALQVVESLWNALEREWLYLTRTPGRFLVNVFESDVKGVR